MYGFLVITIGLLHQIGISAASDPISSTKFMLFTGSTFDDNVVFDFNDTASIFRHEKFDKSVPTTLYFHGYLEHPSNESLHVVVEAYLRRGNHNIIILDWSEAASGNYLLSAVRNAVTLSQPLATEMINWFNNDLVDIDLFSVVSHSLGAQMSGMVGRNIIRLSNGRWTLPRISGLDPANPPFFPSLIYTPLNKNDAKFVDIIHTDARLYGAPVSTGTVDFWPNGGITLQPGCPFRFFIPLTDNDLCSHRRSWRFWAESVTATLDQSFIGVQARTWTNFRRGRTTTANMATMGFACDTTLTGGDYFLQTNSVSPYARGLQGAFFDNVLPTTTEPAPVTSFPNDAFTTSVA